MYVMVVAVMVVVVLVVLVMCVCVCVCVCVCACVCMEWVFFIAFAWDETSIRVAVHFSMNNIYWLCDRGRAVMWSNVGASQ